MARVLAGIRMLAAVPSFEVMSWRGAGVGAGVCPGGVSALDGASGVSWRPGASGRPDGSEGAELSVSPSWPMETAEAPEASWDVREAALPSKPGEHRYTEPTGLSLYV